MGLAATTIETKLPVRHVEHHLVLGNTASTEQGVHDVGVSRAILRGRTAGTHAMPVAPTVFYRFHIRGHTEIACALFNTPNDLGNPLRWNVQGSEPVFSLGLLHRRVQQRVAQRWVKAGLASILALVGDCPHHDLRPLLRPPLFRLFFYSRGYTTKS